MSHLTLEYIKTMRAKAEAKIEKWTRILRTTESMEPQATLLCALVKKSENESDSDECTNEEESTELTEKIIPIESKIPDPPTPQIHTTQIRFINFAQPLNQEQDKNQEVLEYEFKETDFKRIVQLESTVPEKKKPFNYVIKSNDKVINHGFTRACSHYNALIRASYQKYYGIVKRIKDTRVVTILLVNDQGERVTYKFK